jgi:glucan phosphoethanolaminetransferase (alkaline phosphatase superfamily)
MNMNLIKDLQKEIAAISPTTRQIRQFGWLFFVVLTLSIPAWKMWNAGTLADIEFTFPLLGVVCLLAAYVFPKFLHLPYRWWMALGLVLGLIVGNAVVAIVFYAVMTPIGLINRVMGKHIMPLRPDKSAATYWKTRASTFTKADFERQF